MIFSLQVTHVGYQSIMSCRHYANMNFCLKYLLSIFSCLFYDEIKNYRYGEYSSYSWGPEQKIEIKGKFQKTSVPNFALKRNSILTIREIIIQLVSKTPNAIVWI